MIKTPRSVLKRSKGLSFLIGVLILENEEDGLKGV